MNSASSQGQLYHSGNNGLWTQGLYGNGGAPRYYNMYAFQKLAAAPGSTYTADAWFSEYSSYYKGQGGDNGQGSGLLTSDGNGVEDCWVEVQFLDINNNILADYKSVIISPIDATLPGSAGVKTLNVYTWPTVTNTLVNPPTNVVYLDWIHCQVTNVFDISTIGPNVDPATESVTNTLSNGIMTAPPGTAYVQYMLCLAQALYESGANYWDDCTLNQLGGPSPSALSGLSPDGTKFFNTNTSLTFTVNSASTGGAPLPTNPTSGVKVVVNGVDQSANLQFGGTPTALTVALPGITSNAFYNISITISNSAGLLTTANPVFDTLTPVIIVPVETFDYNGGQFIQNPIPTATNYVDSYFGRAGTFGIDMWTYNGTGVIPGGASTLVPNYPNRTDTNEAFEVSSDTQLPLYAAANDPRVYNVDFSYNNAGNWYNYTRNPWPSGNYEVFARISGGQGAGAELLNILTSGYGTKIQTTNNLGQFYLANGTDWTKYFWIPLTDSNGNLLPVNVPSGQQTLQLRSSPIAGVNVISFVFVPFPTAGVPPSINSISPANGTVFAPASGGFSFTALAGLGSAALNSSGIHLSVNGVDVTSSLNISGSGPFNVSYPNLFTNNFYTAVISVTNTAGAGTVRTISFDTMDPANFYVKIEDFDYDSGQWDTAGNGITSPFAYFQVNTAVSNVDYLHNNAPGNGAYPFRTGLATEITADVPLPGYFAGSDYDVGNFNTGDWGNFTRNYPTGKYFAYGRFAGGNGPLTAYLDKVTSGLGTQTQTTQRLGTWRANTGGWQNWAWVPLTDSALNAPVIVTLGGTNTLRVTSGGNINANYFMLVLAQGISAKAVRSGNNVVVSFPTQQGVVYHVYYSTSLSSPSWQLLSTVNGDGTAKSVTDPATGTTRFYKVSSP